VTTLHQHFGRKQNKLFREACKQQGKKQEARSYYTLQHEAKDLIRKEKHDNNKS
jgi:hypothetical protein